MRHHEKFAILLCRYESQFFSKMSAFDKFDLRMLANRVGKSSTLSTHPRTKVYRNP